MDLSLRGFSAVAASGSSGAFFGDRGWPPARIAWLIRWPSVLLFAVCGDDRRLRR